MTAGAALRRAYHARSVAIVGVSEDPLKYGSRLAQSVVAGGFSGDVSFINAKGGRFLGRDLLPSLTAAGPADVVIVSVPSAACPAVVAEAGALGCGCAVVVATGFAEVGAVELEHELAAAASASGIRMIGPNCMGFLSSGASLNAMGDATIPQGRIAVVAQSGIVGMAIYQRLKRHRVGLRSFFSVGNQADIGFAEICEFLAEGQDTGPVLLYVEGIRDLPRTLEAVAGLAARRPVAVLRGGRTDVGARAAAAHTASRPAEGPVLDAALREAGAVLVRSEEELVLAALAFGLPPLRSTSISLVSDSGGFATLGGDLAVEAGLRVEPHSEAVQSALRDTLVPQANARNPVDMIGGPELRADIFERSVDACLADPAIGGAILLGGYAGYFDFGGEELLRREVAAAPELVRVRDAHGKPLVVQTLYADVEHEGIDHLRRNGVPVVDAVDDAVRILAFKRDADEARPRRSWNRSAPPADAEWIGGQEAIVWLAGRLPGTPTGSPAGTPRAVARVAVRRDPELGPVVVVTGGGAAAGTAFLFPPLDPDRVHRVVGAGALAKCVLAVGGLVEAEDGLVALDLEVLVLSDDEIRVAGARVQVAEGGTTQEPVRASAQEGAR